MTIVTPTAAPDQRAALEGCVWTDESSAGRIVMRGRDRAALLHRLSTNNIERLRPGQGARTVLTTPIGRIIDLLSVHALDDALLVLTSPQQGPAVFGHLRKNIFFNDQVALEPAGRSHALLGLHGPRAAALLAGLGAAAPQDLHHSAAVELAGLPVRLIRSLPLAGDGFTLLLPAEGLEALRGALEAAGAVPLSPAAHELLRVERGYGAFGRELSQEYIPLETGLHDAISFTKGCYVGQEIIARMESRNKLAKQLRGLRLSAALDAPAKLEAAGKEAGDLTSAVLSPRFGPIALAYVRTAHAEPGTTLAVSGTDVSATVVELPFV